MLHKAQFRHPSDPFGSCQGLRWRPFLGSRKQFCIEPLACVRSSSEWELRPRATSHFELTEGSEDRQGSEQLGGPQTVAQQAKS